MTSNTNKPGDSSPTDLKSWKVNTPLPAGFERQVWRRIETANQPGTSLIAEWFAEVMMGFRIHKAFTLGFVTIAIVAGVGLGVFQAHRSTDAARLMLSQRYVQSIDPYIRNPH
jgi:ABC-type microcin C transport system permease subunit YejE